MPRSPRRAFAALLTLVLALALVPVGLAGARPNPKDPHGGGHRPDPRCHRIELQQRADQSALASSQAKLKKAKQKQAAARKARDEAEGKQAKQQAQAKLTKANAAVKAARAKVAAAKAEVKESNADAKQYDCGG